MAGSCSGIWSRTTKGSSTAASGRKGTYLDVFGDVPPDDLHGFLNAGVPQIGAREPSQAERAQIRQMSALHRRVALLEMTKHEFDSNYRQERTAFSDGTTVTVD